MNFADYVKKLNKASEEFAPDTEEKKKHYATLCSNLKGIEIRISADDFVKRAMTVLVNDENLSVDSAAEYVLDVLCGLSPEAIMALIKAAEEMKNDV